ncbi:glutathione S-transferase [Rhizopogon vinicolor AM-OR11-026]|uniref:Glutathione-dependent dehydroascorbate reductase n=1 Tax=Rhizopogon vinicolor AM-OR11-026 TaxID=1314800 RepID=A0A1B7MH64_9AGAM|nr:glutathione S-transferase [Rhizopogon vinicolor AM-OR11-026]
MGIPDENIHPTATGNAAKTVAEHQAKQDLVFYSGWFCPFNQRVWISLEEKGIPYQYKEVNPYKKEKHFLDINPKGLVPAIEYQGKALYESLILCEFLEDAYPDYKPHLLPTDPFERAHARLWIDHTTKAIIPAWHRLLQGQTKEQQDAARQELYAAQGKLAQEVKGPYFAGEEFGLVDVANAPWVAREYILAEQRGYDSAQVGNGWSEYVERLATRESVGKTTSEEDKLQVIYDRYLRDEAQSEAAKAIRAGRVIP